ncbi:helix-turn-helix domain-containing protein [Sphingomonas sp. MMS24-J13]|uniref:helix-turn-helix domain-containing protein n=1 Tax=Sphingomonas sp. MMS24-J13 TaxID=3238686 RepID=UPI00384C7315
MREVPDYPQRGPGDGAPIYTSTLHGERTQVEVFSRVPDHEYRSFEMGRMGLIRLRCGSVSIRREAADIRERSNGMSTFIHQVRGCSAFNHYGNQIALEKGDFTLCNNSTQYELRPDGPSEIIMFRVPTAIVHDTIPLSDFLCGRRLAHDVSLAPMAAAMAQTLVSEDPSRLHPDQAERAGRHLLDVLASAYMAAFNDRNAASAVMAARFWKVKLFIEEHLRNPELKPCFIARRMALSDRYLRMIFAVSDEAPSAYILRRRLEECAAQLRDPRWRHYSITNIAFGWGFNSAPHFARSFRSQFGCSASDYRGQALS